MALGEMAPNGSGFSRVRVATVLTWVRAQAPEVPPFLAMANSSGLREDKTSRCAMINHVHTTQESLTFLLKMMDY